MALTAASMMAKIKAYVAAVPEATLPTAVARQDAILTAVCQGIIDEIHQNAVTNDDHGDTGTIT